MRLPTTHIKKCYRQQKKEHFVPPTEKRKLSNRQQQKGSFVPSTEKQIQYRQQKQEHLVPTKKKSATFSTKSSNKLIKHISHDCKHTKQLRLGYFKVIQMN